MFALGGFPAFGHPGDDGRQAMPGAGKARATKSRHRLAVVRVLEPLDQSHGVNQEGTDDRRVEAFVVEHQHRLVQSRLRIHDKTAGAGFGWLATEVRRNETLTVHQRHVQVRERGHRTAHAIGRQTGDAGPLQQEGEQLGPGKNPRDQFAVLEVVFGQRRFVLGEHAIDFVHALVRVVDGLALAEQGLRDVFQAERGETPGRRTQGLDTVDDQAASRRCEVVITAAVFAPLHFLAATPQFQRHRQAPGVFVKHP
ncbi:hypothetical protein D3C73_948690 [compost metagenome]